VADGKVVGRRTFHLFTLVYPSETGGWIGHNLDFDVVSQGEDAEDALESAYEAAAMVIIDDLNDGHEPESVRRKAPDEFYARFERIIKVGELVATVEPPEGAPAGRDTAYEYAVISDMDFVRQTVEDRESRQREVKRHLLETAHAA
jgi:predicted RNase H-like HicB family nuclease